MARPETHHTPVGILSHGQLAMMTGEAGNAAGIPTKVLGPGEISAAKGIQGLKGYPF